MNERKRQRIRACMACPHRRAEPGWDWPRCALGRELDNAFMEGPDSNCPSGQWDGTASQHGDTEDTEKDKVLANGKTDNGGLGVGSLSLIPAVSSSVPSVFSVLKPSCAFGRVAHCCAAKVECFRHDGAVRVVNPGICESCPERIERLRIGAVITAFNEGDQVRQTVESLAASIADARTDLYVILVDDGSTDGSCNAFTPQHGDTESTETGASLANGKANRPSTAVVPAPSLGPALSSSVISVPSVLKVVVVRHEQAQGVGRSRNAGWAVARALGCHVVSFHDAHMRFGGLDSHVDWARPETQKGGLEHLARKAITSGAIVCAGCTGMREGSNRVWCCDLFYNAAYGLQPLYLHNAQLPAE